MDHKKCSSGWHFFFSDDKQRIDLQHGTFIIWDAKQVSHGTTAIYSDHSSFCQPQQWAFAIQTKDKLLNALKFSKGKITINY